eukprot:1090322-Pelagomonas_calceolata.AAC.1
MTEKLRRQKKSSIPGRFRGVSDISKPTGEAFVIVPILLEQLLNYFLFKYYLKIIEQDCTKQVMGGAGQGKLRKAPCDRFSQKMAK